MKIDVFSFFAGLGILDLGFEKSGFNIAFVNEYNKEFLEAYRFARKDSDHEPRFGYSSKSIVDFLDDEVWNERFGNYRNGDRLIGFIGGPPCPDFSIAGKNRGATGDNGILTDVYSQLIVKRKPDFFVLENVKGLYRTKTHREFYDGMKKYIDKNGYDLFDSLENSLEYGVPQSRDRLILVGFNRKRFGKVKDFEIGKNKKYNLKEVLRMPWPEESEFGKKNLKLPEGIIEELTVEHWFKLNDVKKHYNANDCFNVVSTDRFNSVKEGDVSKKSFKRLHRWRFAPTSAYGNNEVHMHPYEPRRLSVAEAMAIQSLPKDFKVPKDFTLSAKFKMVGNGVPFLLSKAIASSIYEFINKYYLK